MPAPEPGSRHAYDAARMRWALEADGERLLDLFRAVRPDDAEEDLARMHDWLEHGGAVLLEDAAGRALSALRWRWEDGGWRVDTVATRPEARGRGFGRWLMTKVEALAIRRNVPRLTLELADEADVPYYRRMGYGEVERTAGCVRLAKRVGGTWQWQTGA